MNESSPCSLVLKFIEYVNQGDIEAFNAMISPDVIFTSIVGNVYQEHGFMAGYLSEFPNYKILVDHALQGGDGVALIGRVSGSHVPPEIEEQSVLVWTVELDGDLITSWRIYAGEAYASGS
jgi:hypothetical protein